MAAVGDQEGHGQISSVRTLQAPGLTLEPLSIDHADAMFLVLRDPAIYEFEDGPPSSLQWLRERYRRLESRRSPDGNEQWLNWIIRLPDGQVTGYVQASARLDGHCYIAYVLGSTWWGQGLAQRSVEAMIAELGQRYGIHTLWAVFKNDNHRSRRLLERLGFTPAAASERQTHHVGDGESLMTRTIGSP